jgi:hypothetical protein
MGSGGSGMGGIARTGMPMLGSLNNGIVGMVMVGIGSGGRTIGTRKLHSDATYAPTLIPNTGRAPTAVQTGAVATARVSPGCPGGPADTFPDI